MRRAALVALALVAVASRGHADGLDLSVWFTRAFTDVPDEWKGVFLIGLMLINYATNALVIALPSVRHGGVSLKTALRDTVGLTLLGQLADRVGALGSLLLSLPALFLLDVLFPSNTGLIGTIVALIVVGVLCSGLVVGALAFHYAHRRWKVERKPALRIAVGAGVLTNPLLWALAAGLGVSTVH